MCRPRKQQNWIKWVRREAPQKGVALSSYGAAHLDLGLILDIKGLFIFCTNVKVILHKKKGKASTS